MGNYIRIFDTTLRDGEQSPGASMFVEDKIKIAKILDEMGVDIIEAGFPVASKGDFESINLVSQIVKNSTVCALARAKKRDVEIAGKSLLKAKKPRIHTFIATSKLHMEYKLKLSKKQVLEYVESSVKLARKFTDDVEWSCEDASRSDKSFLYKCIELAIRSGANTINIPDTVGYAVPFEFGTLNKGIKNNVKNIDQAIISVHCHNDLGLAVSNSLFAIVEGARQVECTVNGLGERAGNASMEEIVMSLKTRNDLLPYRTGINTKLISKTSKLVSKITGFVVQPNKAIVGSNAFAHEAGIHQDGMLKHSNTYEIMTPESVGLEETKLILGKHSGKHAFAIKLEELGYNIDKKIINKIFESFKLLADKKKDLYEEDIIALVDDAVIRINNRIKFISLSVQCGSKVKQKAQLELEIDGIIKKKSSEGHGPVDAVFNCIKKLVPHKAKLHLYQVHAVTEGTDAQAEVTVRLEYENKNYIGKGTDVDTLVASAKAYLHSLNKLFIKNENKLIKTQNA